MLNPLGRGSEIGWNIIEKYEMIMGYFEMMFDNAFQEEWEKSGANFAEIIHLVFGRLPEPDF